VIPIFAEALRCGRQPVIYGDGEQSRGFIYVGDVAEANIRAAILKGAAGHVINLGADVSTTINQVLDDLERQSGIRIEPEHRPARAGDVRDSLADMRKAWDVLRFRTMTSFDEGIRLTLGSVPAVSATAA
jgi:UDP-glucose 4-epimerase